jgi:predicted Zn-ribbon and HTH transcriptional regulator
MINLYQEGNGMMEKILFAGYTVQDVILAAGIGIGILILFSFLKKIFRKEKTDPYMQLATCNDCGWQGQVSRHAGRCPGCNQPLGDRRISRAH